MNVAHHPKQRARLEAILRQRQEELARVDFFFDPATMPPETRKGIGREAERLGLTFDQLRALLHIQTQAQFARRLAEAERDLAAFD